MPELDLPDLDELFPPAVRARGAELQAAGRVRLEDVEPGFVRGVVRGGQLYAVGIAWQPDGELLSFCECPAFHQYDGHCKHLFAALLEAKTSGALTPAGLAPVPGGERAERRGRSAREPEWQRWVQDLARRGGRARRPRDPWAAAAPAEREIRYEIDVEETLRLGSIVLGTLRRKRLKSGRWGAWRELHVRDPEEDRIDDPADRRVLRLLIGAESLYGRDDWFAPRSCDFALDATLAAEVLPLAAGTGRLGWCHGERSGDLAWDDGEPWRCRARWAAAVGERDGKRNGGAEIDELRGELFRGDETRPLADPLVLLSHGFVVFPETIARFDPGEAMGFVAQLRAGGPLRVPRSERPDVERALLVAPGGAWQCVSGLERPQPVAPVPHLFVESGARRLSRGRLACRASFRYGDELVHPEESFDLVTDSRGSTRARDFAAEEAALRRFVEVGVRHESIVELDRHGSISAEELPDVARDLMASGWVVEADGALLRKSSGTSVSVESGTDWFDLEGGLDFDGRTAPFPELLRSVKDGHRIVRLGDGSFGVLPEDWLKSWGLLRLGEASETGVRFTRQQGWLLDALLAERESARVDRDFADYRERLGRFQGVRAKKEPRGFAGSLRDYQRDGLGWFAFLEELGLGGCLADDMGLGKTVQVLALLEANRAKRGSDRSRDRSRANGRVPSLVVAPRSVVFNWLDEAARFAPRLAVLDYTGTDRRARRGEIDGADLVVTTYGTLRRDVRFLAERRFDYAILDEAQAIKNPSSQTAKAARLLRAEHRLALSGTPVENHLGELWSLFEFLNPGMLGRSRAFKELLAGDPSDGDRLARAVRPFVLRRTKEEVLDDLPPKTEQTLHCELGKNERRRYDELRDHFRGELLARADDVGLPRMKIHVLEALLRLRQAACHPALLAPELADEGSAKFDALMPRLRETVEAGHKALVFSQFTKLLGLLRRRLDDLGVPYAYLDGRTRDRRARVERFQNDSDCPLFLISLKAGGHGLNLTAADHVFLLDPWWNPAVEAQAIDRAHRIGRTKPVFAYRLIARDTVEERVAELQAKKRELAEALFAKKGGSLRDLTREDLEALLR